MTCVNPEDHPPGSAYDFLSRLILPPKERIEVDEVLEALNALRTEIEGALEQFAAAVNAAARGDGGATSDQDEVPEDAEVSEDEVVEDDAGQSNGTE